jgi:two-component system sensor histidine kinase UhpB
MSLVVEDDGVGLPPDFRFGFGFLGMSERVRQLGGRLRIRAGAEGGALIEARIPICAEKTPRLPERLLGQRTDARKAEETAIHD